MHKITFFLSFTPSQQHLYKKNQPKTSTPLSPFTFHFILLVAPLHMHFCIRFFFSGPPKSHALFFLAFDPPHPSSNTPTTSTQHTQYPLHLFWIRTLQWCHSISPTTQFYPFPFPPFHRRHKRNRTCWDFHYLFSFFSQVRIYTPRSIWLI